MYQEENLRNFNYASSLMIRKVSNGSNFAIQHDQSIRTSPFNNKTYTIENNTNSSCKKSNINIDENRQIENIEQWNEEDLYNLSREDSKEAYLNEIVEIESQNQSSNYNDPIEIVHQDSNFDFDTEQAEVNYDKENSDRQNLIYSNDNQNSPMQQYIVTTQPHHKKASSSIYSANTQDLHRLLYGHKRELSNGIYSTNKYSETIMSNP